VRLEARAAERASAAVRALVLEPDMAAALAALAEAQAPAAQAPVLEADLAVVQVAALAEERMFAET
jgi:hypothetical protein